MTLAEKLGQIQQEMKAPKNLHNDFGGYNYRSAESIIEGLKPLLAKYRVTLTISDDIIVVLDRIYVKAIVTLVDQDDKTTSATSTAFAREAAAKRGMDDAQVTGSASSYSRKYALAGLFLLDNSEADPDSMKPEDEPKSGARRAFDKAKAKVEGDFVSVPDEVPDEVPFEEVEAPKPTRRSRRTRGDK